MKKYFLTVILSASVFGEVIEVKINGMVCAFCASGVEKKFKEVKETKSIKVDLDTKLVSLTTESPNSISDEKIKELIEEAGYKVENIVRKK